MDTQLCYPALCFLHRTRLLQRFCAQPASSEGIPRFLHLLKSLHSNNQRQQAPWLTVRSDYAVDCYSHSRMQPLCSAGCQYEGSSEIGVFAKLTNAYCIVCDGGSQNFYSVFEAELGGVIPVVRTTIADCKFVGRVTAGEEQRNAKRHRSEKSSRTGAHGMRASQEIARAFWYPAQQRIRSCSICETLCQMLSRCSVLRSVSPLWATALP